MPVSVYNESRIRQINLLKDKMNMCSRKCATIMSDLKDRGIDISGLANMGLSQDEMKMIANYFTVKNEQVDLSCDIKTIENDEISMQSRNRELNHFEADKEIQARKQEEERQREAKHNEEKAASERAWQENNRFMLEEGLHSMEEEPER